MEFKLQIISTIVFCIALLHTFSASSFIQASKKYPNNTVKHEVLHLLGEVEIVFGLWAGIFLAIYAAFFSKGEAIAFLESVDFTEPVFVFVIMTVAATRSIRQLAVVGINLAAKFLTTVFRFFNEASAFYVITLILGPILGSFITEPAAMTVTSLILKKRFFQQSQSEKFKYATLALLFVNISIGGTLTHFAAPPVVMVSKIWNWDTSFMLTHFGWKALIAIIINTLLTTAFLKRSFAQFKPLSAKDESPKTPIAITLIHIAFIFAIVATAHHVPVFVGLFLFFMGVMQVTEPHQDPLQIKESILVGFFLAGLVVLGKPQEWWLTPLLTSLNDFTLFIGSTLLTAVTDNAALTYLGAQVEGLSDAMKYSLVAGAVTGGGLTVIANAPNPAGLGILKDTFPNGGVNPLKLLLAAIIPTFIAFVCFWVLPS